MQSNFSVALSAQISLQKRLETIANNVANASTAGFRAEEVKFESLLSYASSTPVAFASAGQSYLSQQDAMAAVLNRDGLPYRAVSVPLGQDIDVEALWIQQQPS